MDHTSSHHHPHEEGHDHSSSSMMMMMTSMSSSSSSRSSSVMGASVVADEQEAFCHGSGMIMYMDGFHLSLRSGHPCLNLLFDWWTLNARWKVALSLILVFGLAVAVEGLAKFRHVTVAQWKLQQQQQRSSSSSTTTNTTAAATAVRRYSIPVLHGLQAAAGYLLMLIAMTFSLELLCSVVAGLATGYGIFFKLPASAAADGRGDADDPYQLRQHVTTNPCCEFMQEESKETSIRAVGGAGMRRPMAATGFQSNARREGDDNLCLILEGEEDPAPTMRNASRNSA